MSSSYKLKSVLVGALALILVLNFGFIITAQDQPVDKESTEVINSYTTQPNFISPLVDEIPESETIPSPRDYLGHVAGAPGELASYDELMGYYRTLAKNSDRVEIEKLPEKTVEGRSMYTVAISASSNVKNREKFRGITEQLANPGEIDNKQAKALIEDGKMILMFSNGMHSPETGGVDAALELAYRLTVSDKPYIENIRENVISVIIPSVDADGRDRWVDWYNRYKEAAKGEEGLPHAPYWGHYVGHDNNRDGFGQSQPHIRNTVRAWFDWHPPLHIDTQESIPFLFHSPYQLPYNPAYNSVQQSTWHEMATEVVDKMTKQKMPGVWTHKFSNNWFPGYLDSVGNIHNGLGILYESFSDEGANTYTVDGDLWSDYEGWYRPMPTDSIERPFEWSYRNNINYIETAWLTTLRKAASERKEFLETFYQSNKTNANKREGEAWIIPAGQKDPVEVTNLVNLFAVKHNVKVHQARDTVTIKDKSFPEGSYVIKLGQPYGPLVDMALRELEYPVDQHGIPYGDSAWNYRHNYDIEAVHVKDTPKDLPLKKVEKPVTYTGKVHDLTEKGEPRAYVINHTAINNLIRARYKLRNFTVYAVDESFSSNNRSFNAGSFLILAPSRDKEKQELTRILESIAQKEGLDVYALSQEPEVEQHKLDLPRLAILHTWERTMDSGWTRYIFDDFEVPYDLISKDDVRKGDLREEYDLIIFTDQQEELDAKDIVDGISPENWIGPRNYQSSEEFPDLGKIDSTDDITGGIGLEGVTNLAKFVKDGGMLVTLDSASTVPVHYGIVRNTELEEAGGLQIPSSILQANIKDPSHPVTYGYEETEAVFNNAFTKVFDVSEPAEVIASYGEEEILLSGAIKNKSKIEGTPAIVSEPVGEGKVVMFGISPLRRNKTRGSFTYLFNTILNYNDF